MHTIPFRRYIPPLVLLVKLTVFSVTEFQKGLLKSKEEGSLVILSGSYLVKSLWIRGQKR